MRKNRMMRVASALLVVVLLTTCAISGTFAKYVSEGSATDTARVAKWGVTVTTASNTMFLKDYEATTGTFTYTVEAADDDRDYLVAPGTSHKMTDVTLSGVPEVAVNVEFAPTVSVEGAWKDESDVFYCPIIVKIGAEYVCGLDFDNAGAFANAIAGKIQGYSGQFEANTDLSTITTGDLFDISWEWAFSDTEYATAHTSHAHVGTNDQTDARDTNLGDAAVSGDLSINIAFKITVTQID